MSVGLLVTIFFKYQFCTRSTDKDTPSKKTSGPFSSPCPINYASGHMKPIKVKLKSIKGEMEWYAEGMYLLVKET